MKKLSLGMAAEARRAAKTDRALARRRFDSHERPRLGDYRALLKTRRFSMSRCGFLAAALIVLLPAGPCFAVDAKQKMATCKFGADQQRLHGEARDAFLKKCMEDRDDPRGPAPVGAVTAPKQ
jgi:hypothetical protein